MSVVTILLAPEDRAAGELIVAGLKRSGREAQIVCGEGAEQFANGDEATGATIVVWSNATTSDWALHRQARQVLDKGALIPVSVQGVAAPESLEILPPIDLSHWNGADDDRHWKFVLEALEIAGDGASALAREQPGAASKAMPVSEIVVSEAVIKPAVKSMPATAANDPEPIEPTAEKAHVALGAALPFMDRAGLAAASVAVLCIGAGASIILAPGQKREERVAEIDAPQQTVDLALLQPVLPEEAPKDGPEAVVETPKVAIEGSNFEAEMTLPPMDVYAGKGPKSIAAADIDAAALETGPAIVDQEAKEASEPPAPSMKPERPDLDEIMTGVPELEEALRRFDGEYFKDCETCPDMVEIAAGDFIMGPLADEGERKNEGPRREISLSGTFAMAAREVAFVEWDACVVDGGCGQYWPFDYDWGRGHQPVVGVSFKDAQNYVAWLSEKTGETYRLPSEAEWEFAARAGEEKLYSFGNELGADKANYDARIKHGGKTGDWLGRPNVASRYPASAYGLFDMHGNVWEWTADCWRASLEETPKDGKPMADEDCEKRVLKGGAFNTGGWRLRASHRIGKDEKRREMDVGFRVVREIQ